MGGLQNRPPESTTHTAICVSGAIQYQKQRKREEEQEMLRKIMQIIALLRGNGEHGTEYIVKLSDIIISHRFRTHPPKPQKMERKRFYYQSTGKFASSIVLNKDFELVDGYTSYLIAKENGIKRAPAYFI